MMKSDTKQLTELSVAQWQDFIANCAKRATNGTYQKDYSNEVTSIALQSTSGLTTEETWLFELNVGLFLLRKQYTGRHLGYFAHVATSETINTIETHLKSVSLREIATKQLKRLLETAAYLRETAMRDASAPPTYLDIYVELWIGLSFSEADSQRLFKKELTHLVEVDKTVTTVGNGELLDKAKSVAYANAPFSSGSSKSNELFPLVARAWMHFWLKEDDDAWEMLQAAQRYQLKPEQVLRFLHLLEEISEWSRLEAWLSHYVTEWVGHSPESLDEYGRYWEAVVTRLPEAEEQMWRAITSLLPYSSNLYGNSLMRYGRWRQWIDYQLSLGSDPLDFRVKDLQPLEKEEPEALLPFYHQGVEKYVLLKNRYGYKRSVKLLKRLSKLYKKIKQEQRWESFIETFANRHSRLRALQEELRKGKLIP